MTDTAAHAPTDSPAGEVAHATLKSTRPRTRGRDIHEQHRVATPLELLFDLVFVVAIAAAASQLHHGLAAHPGMAVVAQFMFTFFCIWWAWMNYTWFASAYDNDDALFRLLTMVQMIGAAILATGVPDMVGKGFVSGLAGYVVMRLALSVQWIRAGRGDPARAGVCFRYAIGIVLLQIGWVASYWMPREWMWPTLIGLALLELLVPVWAEYSTDERTPWHAHHIAERYSLFTIIVLGECVLGTVNGISGALQGGGWTIDIAMVGLGGMALVLCLWWMYSLVPSGEALHNFRTRAFAWGYGHFFVFAAVAAMGAGLEVVADALKTMAPQGAHAAQGASSVVTAASSAAATAAATEAHAISPLLAISAVAVPQAIFVFTIWALYRYISRAMARQLKVLIACLMCIACVPIAVKAGFPLAWALPLLCIGPLFAIAYNETGRKRHQEKFEIR